MKRSLHLRRVLVVSGVLVLLSATSARTSDEDTRPEFALGGIQTGLRRSPDRYVAALLEVVGSPRCSDPEDTSTCVAETKLVAVYGSKGGTFEVGSVVPFSGASVVGSRFLAFLVPMRSDPDVYGATFLSVNTSDDEQRMFIAELRKAGI